MEPYIQTCGDYQFYFSAPEAFDYSIYEIAAALSKLCRFTGHTRYFYSVAEHSLHCSYLVPEDYALEALLHDAQEAFLGDVASPLKALLPEYQALEHRVEAAIRKHFSLPEISSPSVREADLQMLLLEKEVALDTDDHWPFLEGLTMPDREIQFYSPEVAYLKFMERYCELSS